MVKSASKQSKVKKVAKEKTSSSSSSSSSSSRPSSSLPTARATASSLIANSTFDCSPPLQKNGAKTSKVPLLSNDEQRTYTKNSSEVKQITALIILKNGLSLAEKPAMTQILQEDYLFKNFETVYKTLCKDVIIGKRVASIPLKFLNISTSKADEVLSGSNIRKKYSTFKSYINNTLTVLWRK